MKVKRGGYAIHQSFGPVYITHTFRDSGGRVFSGINGIDGVQYQFYATEANAVDRAEFDAAVETLKSRIGAEKGGAS